MHLKMLFAKVSAILPGLNVLTTCMLYLVVHPFAVQMYVETLMTYLLHLCGLVTPYGIIELG